MATLSDLADRSRPAPVPDWIGALEASQGFLQAAGLPLCGGSSEDDTRPADLNAEAVADAFAQGEVAGRAAAKEEHRQSSRNIQTLSTAFARLDDAAKEALRQCLADTVTQLCLQFIEPHLIDQDQLEKRCEKAASVLGDAPARCRLHLHPDDTALLDPQFASQWTIIQQSDLTRGSLRLEGPDGTVTDGQAGWRRAIAAALLP